MTATLLLLLARKKDVFRSDSWAMLFQDNNKVASLKQAAEKQHVGLIQFLTAFDSVCQSASALADAEKIKASGRKRRRGGVVITGRPGNASALCELAASLATLHDQLTCLLGASIQKTASLQC